MGENKIIKNVSIVIISILIIAIIGLGIYMIFIKNDDNVKDGNYLFTKLEKYELSVNNKVVSIDGKNVKVRKDNEDAFYINDTKILDAWSGDSIYVSDYFIIHIGNAMAGEMYRIFSANGTEISINNDGVFEKIYLENGKLVGVTPPDYECINGEQFPCDEPYKVEFSYDGTSITINKINTDENEGVGKDGNYIFTKLEQVELNENNKSITLNGKIIKLKSMVEDNSIIYVNDKKTFSTDGPGTVYVYITNNLIAVYWEGSMWGNVVGYIGRDGRIITSPVSTYPMSLSSLYIENNKLMATRGYNGEIDCEIPENASKCKPATKVELVYDGNTIEIKEVK